MERSLYIKLKDGMSNSIDPDETAPYEPSHLFLCCLPQPIITACNSERVKVPLQIGADDSLGYQLFHFFSEKISNILLSIN